MSRACNSRVHVDRDADTNCNLAPRLRPVYEGGRRHESASIRLPSASEASNNYCSARITHLFAGEDAQPSTFGP